MELRNLKASDMGAVCKILSSIGVREFKDCFENIDTEGQSIKQIGATVMLSVAGIVIDNIPSAQKDIDVFLASLTGENVKKIQDLPLGDYADLMIDVITKDDFKDFFGRVMKLFNP